MLLFTYRKSLINMVSVSRTQEELKHYMITSLLPCNLLEICGQFFVSKCRFFDANSIHFPLTSCEFFSGFGVPFPVPVRQNVCTSKIKIFLFYQNWGFKRLQIYQKYHKFKVSIEFSSGVVTIFACKIV